MERTVSAPRVDHLGRSVAVQGLCLLAAVGSAVVQLTLLYIAVSPSVTSHIPLPTETAQMLCRLTALLITLLLDLLLLSPFYLGVTAFRYDTAHSAPPLGACFAAYRRRRYRLSLRWRLTRLGLYGGSALLCLLPALALFGWSDALSAVPDALPSLLCRVAGSLLTVAGGIAWGMWMLRYAVAGFLVPETGCVRTALRRSAHLTRRHRGELMALFLRYSGGFLLCVLILPSLLVLPRFYRALSRLTRAWIAEGVPEKHLL